MIGRAVDEALKDAKPGGTVEFRRYPPVVKHPEHGGRPMTMDEITDGERGRSLAKTATEVMKRPQYDAAVDNWGGRGAKMRCRTCMWFVPKDLSEGGMTHGMTRVDGKVVATRRLGRCRKHAPTMSGYPVVWSDDWCGDHKLDEEKA